MPAKIKACPFCGVKGGQESGGFTWDDRHWVECAKCGATGPCVASEDYEKFKTGNELRALAVRKWNNRKQPTGGEGGG